VTWLLRLYPRQWRRRYGEEVAEMLAGRRFSLRTAVDLVAGAIDSWLHPRDTLAAAVAAAPAHAEEKHMLSRILRLDCATNANLSREDHRRSGVAMIGWTLVLTLAWMGLRVRFGNTTVIESLSPMPFLFATLYSMRYTYLKERRTSVKVVFIGGFTLICAAILLTAGWINA